ncbi:hypothetical protein GCM10020295_43970 [Streptomyces cinereospinus]
MPAGRPGGPVGCPWNAWGGVCGVPAEPLRRLGRPPAVNAKPPPMISTGVSAVAGAGVEPATFRVLLLLFGGNAALRVVAPRSGSFFTR